jgi:ABC-2 type transport system permease protein
MSPRDVPVIRIVLGRELRAHLRTALAWTLPLAALVALVCALQPAMANGPLAAKLASIPETMRRALGLEMLDFQRPANYLAANFMMVSVAIGLFAGLLGSSIIAKEETLHTAELLYTQPVSRAQILAGKAACVAVYMIVIPSVIALVAGGLLAVVANRPLEPGVLVQLFVGVIVLAMCFAGAGMLIASLVRDARNATGIVLGVVLGTFFLGIISALSPHVAALRWLSPFKWVEPTTIVVEGLGVVAVLGLAGVAVACAALAIRQYRLRDLHA